MADVPAPFSTYRTTVREEWLDYNGHMHDASYAVVLSDANEELFEALGLSADYRRQEEKAYYTVETHIRFLAECSRGDAITASTTMVDADVKRIRLYTELALADGRLTATGESLYLHVDTASGRTSVLSDERHARVQAVLAAHADLPRPPHLGAGVGAARRASSAG